MAVCGIIAEFNPFHNGHRYLIETARRELNPRAGICVMSGDFVQRGEPAVADKYERARAAAKCGADLVVELPAVCAVNSAQEFAYGAVRTLKALGCVTHLCFGSESADTENLLSATEVLAKEPEIFKASLAEGLAGGLTYAAACEGALKTALKAENKDFSGFCGPNDILAAEYIKQLKLQDFAAVPYAVGRAGIAHDSCEAEGSFASASLIREMLGRGESPAEFMPQASLDEITGSVYADAAAKRKEKLFELLRYRILMSSAEELAEILSVSEGFENVMKKEILKAESFDGFTQACKSKRYVLSRINRIAVQTVLGITKKDYEIFRSEKPYVKILAFNAIGAEIMHDADSTVNFVTNPNKQVENVKMAGKGLEIDMKSAEIYGIISGNTLYNSSDKVNVPKIIKEK
ncbi:MAG: nucleotidyltransferase family protein [Clostridia bacterium]|nr:nucleotidyltransferase family protein [Clostridia bacterium]